jgi:hypothetical protein
MGLYDREHREMDFQFMCALAEARREGSYFVEQQSDVTLREAHQREERDRTSEWDGDGSFFNRLRVTSTLLFLVLLFLSGCTVHTHTWEGPPPRTVVVHRPIVVQRPVVVHHRPQRVVYQRRWSTRRVVRTPARPRRRGYRHR